MNIPDGLLEAISMDRGGFLQDIGTKVGKLYTDHGFPPDMALERLDMSKQQKIAVLQGVCSWLVEHRRLSGAPEKAIDRQRKMNRKMLDDFITKGEVGVY